MLDATRPRAGVNALVPPRSGKPASYPGCETDLFSVTENRSERTVSERAGRQVVAHYGESGAATGASR
jgi:hypothetical protein